MSDGQVIGYHAPVMCWGGHCAKSFTHIKSHGTLTR